MSVITATTAIELHPFYTNFTSVVSLQVLVQACHRCHCMHALTIGLQVITVSTDRHVLIVACM